MGTLYANNDERVTDHAKAFNVFHRIVEQHAYVDPVSDFRSVYVVRAAVRLADYYRSGVPALNLKADPRAAVELLNHAATYFGDLEAQFQLAKMHLTGEGVEGNERVGLHWLSRLAHKNHPGAQAFLAELMWRGKFVHKDANQALVWSTLSVEGAGEQDRIWIEEVHQTIYCGAPAGVRERAGQLVADWRRRAPASAARQATAPADAADRTTMPGRSLPATQAPPQAHTLQPGPQATVRTCENGEPVPTVVPGTGSMPGTTERQDTAPIPAPMPVIDKNAVRGQSAAGGASSAFAPVSGRDGAAPGRPSDLQSPDGNGQAPFGQGFTESGNTTAGGRRR